MGRAFSGKHIIQPCIHFIYLLLLEKKVYSLIYYKLSTTNYNSLPLEYCKQIRKHETYEQPITEKKRKSQKPTTSKKATSNAKLATSNETTSNRLKKQRATSNAHRLSVGGWKSTVNSRKVNTWWLLCWLNCITASFV